jgi:hypothetical protein
VKAPGSNPNNSLSSSVSGNAAQLIVGFGGLARDFEHRGPPPLRWPLAVRFFRVRV